jgi:hypothetical protein
VNISFLRYFKKSSFALRGCRNSSIGSGIVVAGV